MFTDTFAVRCRIDSRRSTALNHACVGDSTRFNELKIELLESVNSDPQVHYYVAVGTSRLGDLATAQLHAHKLRELGFPVELLKADPDIAARGVSFGLPD